MTRTIDTTNPPKLTFFPETEEEAIVQSVYCILNTVQGSVPCYRDDGLGADWLHRPMNAAASAYTVAVSQALARYEPRVRVDNVRLKVDPLRPDYLHPILEVTIL